MATVTDRQLLRDRIVDIVRQWYDADLRATNAGVAIEQGDETQQVTFDDAMEEANHRRDDLRDVARFYEDALSFHKGEQ